MYGERITDHHSTTLFDDISFTIMTHASLLKPALCILTFLLILILLIPVHLSARQKDDLRYRKFRVTLVPVLSTNGVRAHLYNAKYSLNLIAGYHGGLEGYEIGPVNINRLFSRGFQLGAANLTGGDMSGLHIGGLFNYAGTEIAGLQMAGLANIGRESVEGLQMAGIANISGSNSSGLQLAGFMNAGRGSVSGMQFAGFANVAGDDLEGMQISGILNAARGSIEGLMITGGSNIGADQAEGLFIAGGLNIGSSIEGLMISGIGNISGGESEGLLLSGGVNIGTEMEGLMISGVGNFSKSATGVQVGLINIAGEFEGLPVGLISLYGNGRKNIDVWASDGGFTNIGLKLGTRHIYNMISVGFNPLITDRDVWTLGWTIGGYETLDVVWENPNLAGYFHHSDFTIRKISEDGWTSDLNWLYSYRYMLGKDIGNNLAVYAGPALNLLISRAAGNSDYTWYSLIDGRRAGRDYRFWVGFTVGFQIFPH
jgi:hypothetical protein